MSDSPIKQVIDFLGGRAKVAEITGLTYMAIAKWERKGRFPRTEYTGETNYAKQLSEASGGVFTVEQLLPSYSQTDNK